jgi:hypothetical protein
MKDAECRNGFVGFHPFAIDFFILPTDCFIPLQKWCHGHRTPSRLAISIAPVKKSLLAILARFLL